MSVSQIAWLLGYEGSTSFNHAFRRWTGQSPSTARNQKLARRGFDLSVYRGARRPPFGRALELTSISSGLASKGKVCASESTRRSPRM